MKYIVKTEKSVAKAADDLAEQIIARKFGVLHTHNLKQTMNNKGVDFSPECRVLEVCNPHKAAAVLAADMDLNMLLPCRVSVYEKNGSTLIGTILPTAMLGTFSDSPELSAVAGEVEQVLKDAINAAAV